MFFSATRYSRFPPCHICVCVCQLFVRYVRLKNQTKRDILRNKKYCKKTFQVTPAFLCVKATAPKWRRAASSDTSLAGISKITFRMFGYLGFRLDFRLRVYMLKEPLHVLYNFLDINICSYIIHFIRHFSTFLDYLVSTLNFFSRLWTLSFDFRH